VNYNIQNKNGLTAGQIALMSGNKELITLFYVMKDNNLGDVNRLQDFYKKRIE
jgi:hypothetical protein